MLVLSRKLNETIIIDGNIRIMVVGISGSHVRLGIEAPESVGIFREELCHPNRPVTRSAGSPAPVAPLRQHFGPAR